MQKIKSFIQAGDELKLRYAYALYAGIMVVPSKLILSQLSQIKLPVVSSDNEFYSTPFLFLFEC